ncbi:hypothetical protein KJ564_09680 [bacterium]|nr:hypothetical protein [bacterium]
MSLVKDGIPASFTIKSSEKNEISWNTQLPSDEKIKALLHAIRPLILEREPTSFVKIKSLIGKKIVDDRIRRFLKSLSTIYDGSDSQRQMKVNVNGEIINSEKVLKLWLNSYEYHRDQDKKCEFDKLTSSLMDHDVIKAFLLCLITDKIDAIRNLYHLVNSILKEGTTLDLSKWKM